MARGCQRQRGLYTGQSLIEHVYQVAKSFGGTRVHWLTQDTNTTARKLYEHVAVHQGFIQYVKAL